MTQDEMRALLLRLEAEAAAVEHELEDTRAALLADLEAIFARIWQQTPEARHE